MATSDNLDIYIQARMGSNRLPGKTLLEIVDSKSMLDLCCERLRKVKGVRKLILITTSSSEDTVLEKYARSNKLGVFRGRKSILESFYGALKKFKSRNVLRATADNPLVDFGEASRLIKEHFKTGADYSTNRSEVESGLPVGLPIGVGVEIFTKRILELICKNARSDAHMEHINDYVFENKIDFKITILAPLKKNYAPDLLLTVDTPGDMEKMKGIYRRFYRSGKLIEVKDVISQIHS